MSLVHLPALPFEDPVLVFAAVMLLVLVAPALARLARLPDIIGLIVAGVLVGPHGFGVLARTATIELLGTVGLLYIMFLAGLEIDLNQVKKNKAHTAVFGLLTFLIPLGMGTALGYWALGMAMPAAILLASMFSSHTLLTFPAVAKLGLAKSRSASTVIGGTIITDTLALLVLAVVATASHGKADLWYWLSMAALMLVWLGTSLFIIPRLGRWFFGRMGLDGDVEYIFVIALVFVTAWLAHFAGLEPIIGAFLAGLTLNKLIPEKSLLMTRLHFTGNAIFIPFFLLSTGMLVNLRVLEKSVEVWIVIGGMSLVALASKFLAAEVFGRFFGYSKNERALMYGMSVNQAAATLAAVLVGYSLGIFDQNIITGTIIMIGITSLVGSIVTQRAGRKTALEEQLAPFDATRAPFRIMIPLDDKRGVNEVLDLAFLLRQKDSHEPVYPVRVVLDGPDTEGGIARSEQILAHTVVRAMAASVPVTPLTLVDMNVASGVVRSARDNRANLLLLSWSGRRSSRSSTFNRTFDEIVERTHQQVLVARLVGPVNAAGRIVLVLPPFAERQTGFENVLATLKSLAHAAGTSLFVLSSEGTPQEVTDFARSMAPSVDMAFGTIAVWKDLELVLERLIHSDDWLFLMSARKGDISWQPLLERLPGRLVDRFARNNVSVIFPSTQPWDGALAAETVTSSDRVLAGFSQDRCSFTVKSRRVQDVVAELLAPSFGRWSLGTHEISRTLHAISQEEPVELMPDVVLLHAHVNHVEDSMIFLAVCQNGLDIPLVSGSPHILLVLLDPVGQDPARHLKALADIARVVKLPGMVPLLREIKNWPAFREELGRRIQS